MSLPDPVVEIKKLIKEKGVVVEKCKTPSYISAFLNTEDDIILIYKEVRKKVLTENMHNDTSISEGDLTGQPLEAAFSSLSLLDLTSTVAEITEEELCKESTHSPVPLSDARTYLSRCNLEVKPQLPVWVFCCDPDSGGGSGTVLVGSEKCRSDNGVWFKRSWAVEQGRMTDLSPSLRDYCQTHTRISQLPENMVKCELSCSYLINKIMSVNNPSQVYASTALKLRWNKLCPLPPLHEATETTLVTKCGIGRGNGGLHFVWSQLCLLQKYLDMIVENRQSQHHRPNVPLPSSQFVIDYIKNNAEDVNKGSTMGIKLERLLDTTMYSYSAGPTASNCLTLDQLVDASTRPTRPALDLTDKLWHLFIECTTYQELFASLRQLLETKRDKTTKPFIRTSNISRLGQAMLGEAGTGIIDPLEFLVEIGLEKLKEETLGIFSKAQIVTVGKLKVPPQIKFNDVPSSGWCEAVNGWLQWLCRAHCCLEALVNAQASLGLTNDQVVGFASRVVEQLMSDQSQITGVTSLIEKPLQVVAVQIPVQLVDGHISEHFTHWNLRLTSVSDIREIKSIFYRSLHSPFPCAVHEGLVDADTTLSTTYLHHYYCAQLHSVADKFKI